MKKITSQALKTLVALLLAVLMVASTTVTSFAVAKDDLAESGWNAYAQGKIYFAMPYTWTSNNSVVQYCIVQNDKSYVQPKVTLNKITNTDLYYGSGNFYSGSYGSQYDYMEIIANSSGWGDFSNYNNGSLSHYTTPLNYQCNNTTNYYSFYYTSTEAKGASVEAGYNSDRGYALNRTQKVYVYTDTTRGGTYSDDETGGKVVASYYNLSADSTAASQSFDTSSAEGAEYYSVPCEVTLTATANTGYEFVGWYTAASGGTALATNSSAGRTVNSTTLKYHVISNNYTIYARFRAKQYTISYNAGANGTGTVSSTTKVHGVDATLSNSTFTRTGYTQDGWSTSDGGAKVYNLGGSYSTNDSTTLYPHWSENKYTVTVSAGTGGTVSTSSVSAGIATKPSITATPSTGYNFSSWSVTGGASVTNSASATTTVSATAAGTVTANFSKKTYTVNKTETGASGGTVQVGSTTITTGGVSIEHDSYTVTIAAPAGYNVTAVTGISGTTSGLNTDSVTITGVSITAATTIAVTYASAGTPTLDAISDVSKDANTTTFNVTASITDEVLKTGTLTATASSGTTSVATVGSPTVSGSTVTIPVTIKGVVGSSTITVTLYDGGTELSSQSFSVSMAEPTFTIANKDVYVYHKNTNAATVTNGGVAPSSIAYTSGNTSYVTVNATSGKLTAASVPTSNQAVTITATATYGSGYTKTTTYTATLRAPSLTASSSAASGNIGDTATGSLIGSNPDPTNTTSYVSGYSWTSSNSNVVAITDNTTATPTFTFKKNGSATITLTVTYKNTSLTKTATTSITVNDPTVEFDDTSAVAINIGDTATRTATGSTVGTVTSDNITYSSDNTAKATVNDSGVITGVAAGTANITATRTIVCGGQTTEVSTTTPVVVTVRTPTISVGNKSDLKVGASYTPSKTLTNPSSASGKWTVSYVRKSGTTATTDGSTITAVNYGSKTTFTAQYKYDGTVVATDDFDVTPVTPTISAYSYSAINIGGTANPSVTKANVDNMTVSYSIKSGSAVTINSTNGQITGVVPTASNATTVTVTYTYGSCSVSRDATVTVRTPTISQADVTIAKGDSKTLSPTSSNPTSGLTYTYALKSAVSGVSVSSATVSISQSCSASSAIVVITASYGGNAVATKEVTVTIEAPSVTMNDGTDDIASNATLYKTVGQTLALASSTSNINDASLRVTSSNTSVASVSGTTITMAAPGTTTITVTAYNGIAPVAASPLMAYGITPSRIKPILASVGAGDGLSATSTFTLNVSDDEDYKLILLTADKTNNEWSSAYIHYQYNDGSNHSVALTAMTQVGVNNDGNKVFAYRMPIAHYNGMTVLVFNDSSTWPSGGNSNNWHQTVDITTKSNGYYLKSTYDGSTNKRNVGTWTHPVKIPQIQITDPVNVDRSSTSSATMTNLTDIAIGKGEWSSGNTDIATVTGDEDGATVTGVYPGDTTLTGKVWAAKPYDSWTTWTMNDTTLAVIGNTATADVHVTADSKTITYQRKYTDNGTSWNNATDSQGTFTVKNGDATVTSGSSVAFDTILTLTATPASGYAVEGIYWSNNSGTTWTKVECAPPVDGVVTNNTFHATDNFLLEARFIKVYKLSAFDSYTSDGSTVTFVTAPPKSITIKHTNSATTPSITTYTYTYDGTKAKGNPNSPDAGANPPAALPIASGTYGQGNYIQFYPGDEITLTYSAMASSEIIKGVFYNNSADFYVNKPEVGQFVAHDYAVAHTLYMNRAYYDSVPAGLPSTTADPDAHSIKFTGTQDYKNIDVEIGSKRKIYFSDYDNTVIQSKNTDDYYYDGEDLSVTGDQLIVKAAKSATQTNSIDATQVRYYKATAEGGKGTELTAEEKTALELSISGSTSTSSSSDDGAALIFNGHMPAYDLYIDLNMSNTYTLKLGSKVIADPFESKTRLAQVATVKIKQDSTDKLTAPSGSDVTSTSADIDTGTTIALSSEWTDSWGTYYMFVGWYWGTDSAPDYEKGFISDKASLNYTPKKGGTIWAVGTRSLYINGSKYITGKDTDWYSESDSQKNLLMEFDAESGKYYWEITDTMFAAAGYNYKTWKTTWDNWDEQTTDYGIYKKVDSKYYWTNNSDSYHGKSFFQIFDQESGNSNKVIWKGLSSFTVDTPANGPTYGKIYPRDYNDSNDEYKKSDGQGFINFNETDYNGFSSPLRIYYDPNADGNARLTVEATPIYCDLYVSNGFDVGSTSRTSAVTVQPVVDGVVKTSGQAGYFDVNKQGDGWDPDIEGHVDHYKPKKKAATVRITKTAGGSDKISAFFIYDVVNKTVRAEKNVQVSGSNYYIDLTLPSDAHKYYIVPIVEEAGANVTITFDAAQLNRAQWGDIVSAYAWYSGSGGDAMGGYPGQPMIPSDDMSTWTATFKGTNGSSDKIAGITFTNYVDNIHSWLGCSGVMGTVTYGGSGTAGSPTTVSIADGAIIKQYNMIESGTNKEYSRANFKAQTYDYREPIALYDRSVGSDHVSISFSMKDGNSSLVSWHHSELLSNNILSLPSGWTDLNWEYLKNAKGDKYVDMNGNTIKTKPTASFYVAAKGQVMYNNSSMTNVFYGGKGYDAVSDVTYGGANGVNMNYAVQWYIYDASGNYITNVLSAGIADLSSNGVDSYIGKALEDLGYAVDGKSVSVCYDKPRYMYGDSDSGSGAIGYNSKRINVGNDFDAYRFTGQWNVVASNDLVSVKVGVGMMTDSGEVLAGSNTAAYGNASAMYDTTKGNNTPVTDSDGNTAPFTAPDSSFVRTSVRDAEKSPVKLNASSQNFIGWYYYDANTGDFVKANYASNENYYPNYSNKDVTFYAMYHASAVYQFNYTGREGTRTYSASGDDLTEAEMGASNVINPASHADDIKSKVPTGITRFKKDIDFKSTSYDSWTKTPEETGYILNISGFRVSTPTFTLTAHYKDANGDLRTLPVEAAYDTTTVDLTTLNGGTAVTSLYGQRFLGWYERKSDGTAGDLISTQANYGLRLTGNQNIIAVYDETGSSTRPEDLEGWHVSIDDNLVTKELTTDTSGVFYNDTIVRVRNGSDVKAELPGEATIGVLVVVKDDGATKEPNTYNTTQLGKLVAQISSGNTAKTKNGLIITNMQTPVHTQFNRTDIAVRSDFAKTNGKSYCVYAYMYDGSAYHFSDPSAVKTYE